jgi:hypothetical protein
MKSIRLLLTVAALSVGITFPGGTRAEDWKPVGQAGYFGIGKAYEIEKGHVFWVGEFSGTFFNDKGEKGLLDHAGLKCPAWDDTDLNNKKSKGGGYCVLTDPEGDQAYLTWRYTGDTVHYPGTFEWTGGTGKYKDIKGSNNFVANPTARWPDGTVSGYATWNR